MFCARIPLELPEKTLTNPFQQKICQMIKSRTAIRDMTQKMLRWHSKDAFFSVKLQCAVLDPVTEQFV